MRPAGKAKGPTAQGRRQRRCARARTSAQPRLSSGGVRSCIHALAERSADLTPLDFACRQADAPRRLSHTGRLPSAPERCVDERAGDLARVSQRRALDERLRLRSREDEHQLPRELVGIGGAGFPGADQDPARAGAPCAGARPRARDGRGRRAPAARSRTGSRGTRGSCTIASSWTKSASSCPRGSSDAASAGAGEHLGTRAGRGSRTRRRSARPCCRSARRACASRSRPPC